MPGSEMSDRRIRRIFSQGRLALAFVTCALLAGAGLRGQTAPDSETYISTDRPSVANSSVVVPRGDFQVENGLLVTDTQRQTILDLPESDWRFGLLDKTELRLSVPDYFYGISGPGVGPSGFGDMAVGVKQQLGPTPGNFNLSAIVFVSFPTGTRNISSGGYDPGLQLPWSRQLSANWTAGGQVAFYWPTERTRNFTGETTFFLDRQLTKPWDAFVEYAGDFPHRGGSRQILHFGSSYKLSPRQQIDFQIAAGLSPAAPHMFVGVGYSFLLRVPK